MSKKKKYFEENETVQEEQIEETIPEKQIEEEKKNIVLRDIVINVGETYTLKKGQVLPKEIRSVFFSSLKTEKII